VNIFMQKVSESYSDGEDDKESESKVKIYHLCKRANLIKLQEYV